MTCVTRSHDIPMPLQYRVSIAHEREHEHTNAYISACSSRPGFSLQSCPARRRSTLLHVKVCEQPPNLCAHSICKPSRAPRTPNCASPPAPTNLVFALLPAQAPTSLRHVLIRTTLSPSFTTRRSVRKSLSPISRHSRQRPRSTSAQHHFPGPALCFHVECDCYTCSRLICNCLWNSRAVCSATRRALFPCLPAGQHSSTTSMGWVGLAAVCSSATSGDWTELDCGWGSCGMIKSISSRQLTCNPMQATCRTQEENVSRPIASCYQQLHAASRVCHERLALHNEAIPSARARAKPYKPSY